MALDFLKQTEERQGFLAIEKAALLYNLLTTVLLLCMFGRMDHPYSMLADRGMIALITVLSVFLHRLIPYKLCVYARVILQMSLLSYWYPDTFEFNRCFPNLDHLFASVEQFLFHGQPSIWFSDAFPQSWVSESLNLGYFFYYPMMLIVLTYCFVRRYCNFDRLSFVLISSFFAFYLFYIFVPAAGPQFYFPAIGMDNVTNGVFPAVGDYFNHQQQLLPAPGYSQGVFYNLVEASQQVGERPTAAFPSSHVGVSTILMIMIWRDSRKLFFCLLPFYLLLCLATVYIQAHYLIDSIAGFLLAFPLYGLLTKVYARWFSPVR